MAIIICCFFMLWKEANTSQHVRERKVGSVVLPTIITKSGDVPSPRMTVLPTINSVEEIIDLSILRTNKLFSTSLLNQWDYPIFDLSAQFPTTILSMVSVQTFYLVKICDIHRLPVCADKCKLTVLCSCPCFKERIG